MVKYSENNRLTQLYESKKNADKLWQAVYKKSREEMDRQELIACMDISNKADKALLDFIYLGKTS